MGRGFLSQKRSGVGRGVKQSSMADKEKNGVAPSAKEMNEANKDGVAPFVTVASGKILVHKRRIRLRRVAYPVVANYVRNTCGKYGLVKSMLNSFTGIFSFQFSSMDGWIQCLKMDGLSAIATKLGTPLMLDSYTSDMCIQSWGRSSFARAMIEVQADVELKETIVVAMPKLFGEGFYTCTDRVEYEWKPLRCACCKVFGHIQKECPKNPGLGEAKNLNKPSQTTRGVPVGPKVGFKRAKEYRPLSKKPTTNTSGNKKKGVEPTKEVSNSNRFDVLNSVDNDGERLEKLIIDGKVTLVDDDGKPLKKVDYPGDHDSEDEVETVDNDIARSMALENTSSKVTLDQLLTEQVPGNIVCALGGRGKKKDTISSKDVLFSKADESPFETAPEITSDSEFECDIQEPLPPLPKLLGAEPNDTSKDDISLADLTLTPTVSDEIKKVPDKRSMVKVLKKKAQLMTSFVLDLSFAKKANASTEKLLLTLMEERSNQDTFRHLSICLSIRILSKIASTAVSMTITLMSVSTTSDVTYVVAQLMRPLTVLRNLPPTTGNQGLDYLKRSVWYLDSGCSKHMTGVKQYLHIYSKESGPKVVFGDNCSRDTNRYGSVNCNGITFTRVAYVNGLKHNFISINKLCDANFKVLFTKTQRTIFNQNNEVVLIAPKRRCHPTMKKAMPVSLPKLPNSVNWLWHKRLSHLNFKNINKIARQNLVVGLPSLIFSKDKTCLASEKGKHHRASFKTKRSFSISKCLHLLHMDLFGPKKSVAADCIMSFIRKMENLNEVRVKELRSDNGTEFRNHKVILPQKSETIYDAPLGFVGLYTHHFSLSNLILPIPLFICDVLNYFKAYDCEPSVDLLQSFLNLGRSGDWLTLSNRGGADVPKALIKPVTHLENWKEMDFRSFMVQGVDGEFNFLLEGGFNDNQGSLNTSSDDELPPVHASTSSFPEVGEKSKAAGKRKLVVDALREGSHHRARKALVQASKVAGDASTSVDVDSDHDIHGKFELVYVVFLPLLTTLLMSFPFLLIALTKFPSARELKDATDCHQVVAHVTPPSWKQQLRDISIEQLYDIHDRAYMRSVKGLESERERLKDSEIQVLQEIDSLRQDRAAIVSKVIPDTAMKLVHSDEIGVLVARLVRAAIIHGRCTTFEEVAKLKEPFVLEKMPGYRTSSKDEYDRAGEDMANASYPFLSEFTSNPYASVEQLLTMKPQTLHLRRLLEICLCVVLERLMCGPSSPLRTRRRWEGEGGREGIEGIRRRCENKWGKGRRRSGVSKPHGGDAINLRPHCQRHLRQLQQFTVYRVPQLTTAANPRQGSTSLNTPARVTEVICSECDSCFTRSGDDVPEADLHCQTLRISTLTLSYGADSMHLLSPSDTQFQYTGYSDESLISN
ncbi:retrovirus-related pol polyprotein from transposon TNT 1-94 [Tanacetum coccineum]